MGKAEAEVQFRKVFPTVFAHMKSLEHRLKTRADQGTYWWELRSCANYSAFENEKLVWQDISYHSRFCNAPKDLIPEQYLFCPGVNRQVAFGGAKLPRGLVVAVEEHNSWER